MNLIKISSKEIVDVLRYDDGKAVIVEKNPILDTNQFKAGYSVVDFEKKELEVLTKKAYLYKKFGTAYEQISTAMPIRPPRIGALPQRRGGHF